MEGFVAKANDPRESRTALTPDSAEKLIGLGVNLSAEAGLGIKSGYPDRLYVEKGVRLRPDDAALSNADLILGLEIPRCPNRGPI